LIFSKVNLNFHERIDIKEESLKLIFNFRFYHYYPTMKSILKLLFFSLLFLSAITLIFIGVKANMQPPIWTGVGFFAILGIFWLSERK